MSLFKCGCVPEPWKEMGMDSAIASEMRQINRRKIFDLIYAEKRIARIEIADRLGLSLPTVTHHLQELEDMHLIERNGVFQSTGGRKPQAITCVSTARIAIGTEISKRQVRMVAVDLYGEILKRDVLEIPYQSSESYRKRFGEGVNAFCDSLRIASKKILGIGIAIQGILSRDGSTVLYGKILGSAGVRRSDFAKHLKYPCSMIHDADAAAFAETWFAPKVRNAVYIHLHNYLGGALILDRDIHRGSDLEGGLIEHITLHPGGKQCYCGRFGCFSMYCSMHVLLSESGCTLEDFFDKLRSEHDQAVAGRWNVYLGDLATAISSIHMVIDCDVILGGGLSAYMNTDDLERVWRMLYSHTEYSPSECFIQYGRLGMDNAVSGAALQFVDSYLTSL